MLCCVELRYVKRVMLHRTLHCKYWSAEVTCLSFPPAAAGTGSSAIGLSVAGGVSISRTSDGPALAVTGNGEEGQGEPEGQACVCCLMEHLAGGRIGGMCGPECAC